MTWRPPPDVPGPEDVLKAAAVLGSMPAAVHRTPVIRSRILDELYGKQLFLKAENLQKVGAFKARGACHAVARMPAERRRGGILTYSSGNHAQAVAYAAGLFGASARVFMPSDAPSSKVAAVRRYGAEVLFAGTSSEHRRQAALEEAQRRGAVIVEPFDDRDIIAGQGTAGLELLEDVPELDELYVPVGGGGLCAGVQLAALAMGRTLRVIGVEPAAADSLCRSLEAGEPVAVEPGATIADGLRPVRVGQRPFAVLKEAGTSACRVRDEELVEAMRDLLSYCKLLVEPSGAAGLAAARRAEGQRVGVLLSGGNVDLDRLALLLGSG
jgi:threo-3-hydroxy-L-aspartate ammonia-lyase